MKAPCLNCENKGCGAYHSQCEKYIEYRKAKDLDYEKRAKKASFYKVPKRRNAAMSEFNILKTHKR